VERRRRGRLSHHQLLQIRRGDPLLSLRKGPHLSLLFIITNFSLSLSHSIQLKSRIERDVLCLDFGCLAASDSLHSVDMEAGLRRANARGEWVLAAEARWLHRGRHCSEYWPY